MIGVKDKIWSLRQGLFAKYVFALVGLVIFVLAVNGAMETWISYRATRATLTGAMGEKAEATARRIEQSIAELERQVSWVTRAYAQTLAQHNADYAQLLNQVAPVSQLTLLDGAGHEQLKMSRSAPAWSAAMRIFPATSASPTPSPAASAIRRPNSAARGR